MYFIAHATCYKAWPASHFAIFHPVNMYIYQYREQFSCLTQHSSTHVVVSICISCQHRYPCNRPTLNQLDAATGIQHTENCTSVYLICLETLYLQHVGSPGSQLERFPHILFIMKQGMFLSCRNIYQTGWMFEWVYKPLHPMGK